MQQDSSLTRDRCLRFTRVGVRLVHLIGMDTKQPPHPTLEPLLDVTELADYLGVPLSTVYDWRSRGLGPRAYRFGKRVKFALSDVQSWMEAQREPGPAEE